MKNSVFIVSVAMIAMMSGISHANNTVYEKDGKTYQGSPEPDDNLTYAKCGRVEGLVSAQQAETGPLITISGIKKVDDNNDFFRLRRIAKEYLTPMHTVKGLRFGCLTENGGLGVHVAHLESAEKNLSIQIDNYGRVFIGYDKVGLKLIKPKEGETQEP